MSSEEFKKLEELLANDKKIIEDNYKKIEELFLDLQDTNSQLADVSKRCIKAIKYIESYINQFNGIYPTVDMRYLDLHKLLGILKGEDKE